MRWLAALYLLLSFFAPACCDHAPDPDLGQSAAEPLRFKDGVFVYLAPETDADPHALEYSGYTKTSFTDPEGNEWLLSTLSGLVPQAFLEDGYTDAWFATASGNGQRFFCKFFPGKPAPAKDPMIDAAARCSVFVDAGRQFYARLERTADAAPCPNADEYKQWLPRVESHPVPLRIP